MGGYIASWEEIFKYSFQNLWADTILFLPEIIVAIVIVVGGLMIASMLGQMVRKFVDMLKVDDAIRSFGIGKGMEDAGVKFNFGALTGWMVKWFFIILTLMTAADVLELTEINDFLKDIAGYIPNVVVAVVILGIGLVVAQFITGIIEKAASASKVAPYARVLGTIARWTIIVFAFMAALEQIKVAEELVSVLQIVISAASFGLALAFGLAFGLGGKDKAKDVIDRLGR